MNSELQVLYNLICKSLKNGVFDTPEEVISAYNALTNISNKLTNLTEIEGEFIKLQEYNKKAQEPKL